MLKIKTFKGGYDSNFSYILYDEITKEACILDTAIEPKILLDFISENDLKLKFVLILHSHFDHVVGYNYYRENGVQIGASEHFKDEVDLKLKDGDVLKLGGSQLKVIFTPGHIYDCICVLVEGKLFTSDTLFIDGCGRCDLSGANVEQMYDSLQKIKNLPEETIIYPGHDYGPVPFATLKEQKKTNLYLVSNSKEEFIEGRM
jgi:hydroxyacylglutathione hydrolase